MNEEKEIETVQNLSAEEVLSWAYKTFSSELLFATSFGAEDMVLFDMIARFNLPITIITLDTGRLPVETYELMERVRERYSISVGVYFPNQQDVENLVLTKGFFSFRDSVENRKECCQIRKIEGLRRALKGKKAWLTGLRQAQSVTRETMKLVENDAFFGDIVKINPLKDWSEEQVWDYLKKYRVPYNRLHDQGYPSIGCAPCTRAIAVGEDIRAGRWWWENPEQKECGLHRYNEQR